MVGSTPLPSRCNFLRLLGETPRKYAASAIDNWRSMFFRASGGKFSWRSRLSLREISRPCDNIMSSNDKAAAGFAIFIELRSLVTALELIPPKCRHYVRFLFYRKGDAY